ncbi:MAG: hypothetical protein R3D00_03005 [Bacteroidia bacterium]
MPVRIYISTMITAVISAGLYYILLFHTPRENFFQLIFLFGALSACYILLVKAAKNQGINYVVTITVLFHLIPLISPNILPVLSDDFYRFVWDGQLLVHGINPFAAIPEVYMENPPSALAYGLTEELFRGLNSKAYFTIYPPVLQGVFYLSARISPESIAGSVMVMKGIILVAEAGSIWMMVRLLRHFQLPVWQVAWYAFNPLVIVELSGNLHFEALMIFFLLWAFLWLAEGKWLLSSIPFALAVGSKLLPLMLLPLLIRRLGWGKTLVYGTMVVLITGMLFIPVFDLDTFLNLYESIDLYFHKFEFNASIYYLIRWVGYRITGYNIIQLIGKYLALAVFVGIGIYTFLEKKPGWKNLPESFVWIFLMYFSLASIVHPWYTTTLVAFSVFTRFRFPVIWSLVVPLSYFTYRTTAYHENLWLTALEYLIVVVWIIFEVKNQMGSKTVKPPDQPV